MLSCYGNCAVDTRTPFPSQVGAALRPSFRHPHSFRSLGVFCALLLFLLPLPSSAAHTKIQTPSDSIPDLCDQPTLTAVGSGAWNAPTTWNQGRVPNASDDILIPAGTTVTLNASDGQARCVGTHGTLTFSTTLSTRLTVTHLLVYQDGTLRMGTQAQPIPTGITAELVFRDTPLDTTRDPQQYGNGVLVWGTFTAHGAAKTPPFVRLAPEPKAGDTVLSLFGPVSGWKVGDTLHLPDSRFITAADLDSKTKNRKAPQWEDLTIAGVRGTQLDLASPLQFTHPCARDGDLTTITTRVSSGEPLCPHIVNLSRNVTFRSENPNGTRAHMIALDRAAVDIRYALFQEMGRTSIAPINNTTFDASGAVTNIGTNQIGRYPLHLHHVYGPFPVIGPYQFQLLGNVLTGSPKWGVTIHDSHYGLVEDNVVVGARGAGFATEDGSESYNLFKHNFASAGAGSTARTPRGNMVDAVGVNGGGYWLKGLRNTFEENVAAGSTDGFEMQPNVGLGTTPSTAVMLSIPRFQGASTKVAGEYFVEISTRGPVLAFRDNEGYGQIGWAFGAWLTQDFIIRLLVEDFRAWNAPHAVSLDYSHGEFRNLVARGSNGQGNAFKAHFVPRRKPDSELAIVDSDIQNYFTPWVIDGRKDQYARWERVYFRNKTGMQVNPRSEDMRKTSAITRRFIDLRFDPMSGDQPEAFVFSMDKADPASSTVVPQYVLHPEQNFLEEDGRIYQLFYTGQAPQNPFPRLCHQSLCSCPEDGHTNQTCSSKFSANTALQNFQTALFGDVAACATSRPDMKGVYVCLFSGPSSSPTPTPSSSPLTTSAISASNLTSSSAQIRWTTNRPSNSQVEYGLSTTYGQSSTLNSSLVTSHTVNLTSLTPNTFYHYRVRSADASGNVAVSPDQTFTTSGGGTPTPTPTGTPTPTPTPTPISTPDTQGPLITLTQNGSAVSTIVCTTGQQCAATITASDSSGIASFTCSNLPPGASC